MDQPSDSFPFERIAAACREHRLREKVLVVPSLAIGHQIADRIAREGTAWVNLRAETIRTLTDAVTAERLAAEGIRVLSRAQALALVEQACAEVLGTTSYFALLADRPGLHRAIQRSLDDLRLAGASSDALLPGDFEDARKGDDLRHILDAYQASLDAGRFIDRAGVTLRAARELASEARRPWSANAIWIVVEDDERPAAEAGFLTLAAAGEVIRIGAATTIPPRATWRFVRAAGEENELRGAFRAILESGRPFDEAEIAYATREVYLPLAWELASEHAIPATFAEGVAAHYTRPGKAAIEILRWIEGWEDVHLRRAAGAGALECGQRSAGVPPAVAAASRRRVETAPRDAAPTAAETAALPSAEGTAAADPEAAVLSGPAFARTLREAAIGWGRARHLERLEALEAEREAEVADPEADEAKRFHAEARLARATKTRALVAELLATIAADEEATIGTIAAAIATILEARGAVRSEIDGMARSAIVRLMREIADVSGETETDRRSRSLRGPETLERAEVCARLRDAILALHVGASNPRPGLLHIAPVRAAGWSGRPLLFVAGLEESRYPGSGIQDPILLDAERARVNERLDPHELPLRGDRPRRIAGEFRRLLGRLPAAASVALSWPSLDLRERRESFPSQLLLEVFREARALPGASYDDLAREVGSVAFVPKGRPLSMSEWWLDARFGEGGSPLGDAPLVAYPWLADGRNAIAMRAAPEITPWDGMVEAPAEELDPRRNGRVYSASALERMARCPYGYFLERILGIEPFEEVDRSEEWLSAMQFGSVFHEVLETFMREICARGEKPNEALHHERLAQIARETLEREARKVPPPSESAKQARVEDLLESCALFLRIEEKRCGEIDAKFFEVGFGFGESGDDGIDLPEPLTIDLGKGRAIKLRGYIDRVDHHPTSDTWHVWDYKSGGVWDYGDGGSLTRGTVIQHAIYARALEAMLAARGESGQVSASGYYFPTVKGRGARIARSTPPGALESALNLVSDVVASGWFPQGDNCKFCDFQPICLPSDDAGAAEAKIEANARARHVAAWRKLQEVK